MPTWQKYNRLFTSIIHMGLNYTVKLSVNKFFVLFMTLLIMLFGLVSNTTANKNVPQVIGGQEAQPGAWPWMAALVLAPVEDTFVGHFCGGTLIASNWVLTAAHCVKDLEPHYIDVVLGRHNLTSDEGERISITQKIVHPDYNPNTLDSDLALLKLERPSSQQTAQLITANDIVSLNLTDSGIMSIVTGWGNTSPNTTNHSEALQEVELPMVARQICNAPEAYDGTVTINMICAGYQQGGEDSCKGDSGGPLVIYGNGQETWILAGVVSWGKGCAQPNHYGVYTHLSNFHEWINDKIYQSSYTIFLPIIVSE